MRILIACEFSGVVRDAFRERGHDAYSCDIIPSEPDSPFHLLGDCREYLKGFGTGLYNDGQSFCDLSAHDKEKVNQGILDQDYLEWDMLIAHPPCTYLCRSGWHWVNKPDQDFLPLKGEPRRRAAKKAAEFFMEMLNAPIPRICVENPRPIRHVNLPPFTQVIQPWQFGHGEVKATCLWLRGLNPLVPTQIVNGRKPVVHFASPNKNRGKDRSRTHYGIAQAMAEQWGNARIDTPGLML